MFVNVNCEKKKQITVTVWDAQLDALQFWPRLTVPFPITVSTIFQVSKLSQFFYRIFLGFVTLCLIAKK